MPMIALSDSLTVSGQLGVDDIDTLAQRGVRTVICNRPDGETPDQPRAAALAQQAAAHGMQWLHIPVTPQQIGDGDISAFRAALSERPGPVHAFCGSGMRSTMLWAMSQAAEQSPEVLIARAADAGYDISALAPRLAALAGPPATAG